MVSDLSLVSFNFSLVFLLRLNSPVLFSTVFRQYSYILFSRFIFKVMILKMLGNKINKLQNRIMDKSFCIEKCMCVEYRHITFILTYAQKESGQIDSNLLTVVISEGLRLQKKAHF